MAQTLTAIGMTQLASAMVAGLYAQGVLVNTVWRDAETDLVVGRGDSVTIREPQIVAAANFTGTASISEVVEGKIVVPVNQQPYSQVVLSAKEKTFGIEQLATQVVRPQVAGIIEYIEEAVATKLESTTGAASAATADGWAAAALAARTKLTQNKVPLTGRWLACAPDVVGDLLEAAAVTSWANPGAPDALANGTVGRLYGFNIVESPFITAATAVAYHSTAVAGVFRTPVPPEGGVLVGSASLDGFSAQALYAYDSAKLADSLTVQTLFGLGSSNVSFDERALKVTLTV